MLQLDRDELKARNLYCEYVIIYRIIYVCLMHFNVYMKFSTIQVQVHDNENLSGFCFAYVSTYIRVCVGFVAFLRFYSCLKCSALIFSI